VQGTAHIYTRPSNWNIAVGYLLEVNWTVLGRMTTDPLTDGSRMTRRKTVPAHWYTGGE